MVSIEIASKEHFSELKYLFLGDALPLLTAAQLLIRFFSKKVLGGSKCIQAILTLDLIVVTHHFRDRLGVLLRMLLTKRPWLRP